MKKTILLTLLSCLLSCTAWAAETFVSFTQGDVHLNAGSRMTVYVDDNDCQGVRIAVDNLCTDINKVCGTLPQVTQDAGQATIIAGTLGHSSHIDNVWMKNHKDLRRQLQGKREKYIITTEGNRLYIIGSDRRGTVYGIYELSRQIGVSPWYWWADTPVRHHNDIYIKKGIYTDGEPAVRYRGLFINDEAPCLTSWVTNTWGTRFGEHDFYARLFELILRLKGNMLWPPMWVYAFYADDPLNSKTADEMGVIIGTSHHEPMARNHQEWARNRKNYGAWNYTANQKVIDRFFQEGIERMKGTEDIVTIGMRGDGDEAMSPTADVTLLENIIDNQRKIIAKVTRRPARETPQMWALYKEVQDYYDQGLRVPDDVTILLSDDNWGDVRRVPSAKERNRKGGWGLYYHVDYVGAPRNSKWLNVTPIQNMWEQLTLAYEYGIDRIWMLNVGDLKPMEYPISLYFDMAWDPTRYDETTLLNHATDFCRQQFGAAYAEEAARILNLYCKYNGRVTPEMLDRNTYNLETGEWAQVVTEYTRLETEALRLYTQLPEEYHNVFQEIILFPVQAMANLYQMYYAQAMNHKLYKQHDPDCNLWADRTAQAFQRDSLLCRQYNHEIADGKWNGMMTQKHIGYTEWNDDFPKDRMPEVYRLQQPESGGYTYHAANGYVAMEAARYFSKQDAAQAHWTELPFMGRTLSGMLLRPYTASVDDASLTYRFSTGSRDQETDNRQPAAPIDSIRIHIIVKSTLDFLNKGGLCYQVSLDGSKPQTVNFNADMNEKPENIHTHYYPTVSRRVIEKVVTLPAATLSDGPVHTLVFTPLDPGIVLQRIVVDLGGYRPSYLFMTESPKSTQQ